MLTTDVASAEMIKYASNAFLATKISFINEIANVCEVTGADVTVVAKGMGLDRRIGPHFLQAGIGYGGSCFPKDVSALKQIAGNSGYHFQLLNAVIEVNELQKRKVIGKLKHHLGDELRGRRIALLGLAFKPNTDDIRQASSIVLAERLMAEGAQVVGYDPVAMENMQRAAPALCCTASALSALEGADACVLVTEWKEFLELDWAAARGAHGPADRHRRPERAGRWAALTAAGVHLRGCGEKPRAYVLASTMPRSWIHVAFASRFNQLSSSSLVGRLHWRFE